MQRWMPIVVILVGGVVVLALILLLDYVKDLFKKKRH